MKKKLYIPIIWAYILLGAAAVITGVLFEKKYPQLKQVTQEFMLAILVIYLASFIVLVFFGTFVYRKIHRITEAAAAYGRGEYTEKLDIHGGGELENLSAALNYMAHRLNTMEDDQRKFISNVSHDFRSPLTSIRGYAQAMKDGVIPPELQSKYLDIIIFETERLNKLTENLLELNKYGTKGFYLDITDFDINALILRTIQSFEHRCREKNIVIVPKLSEGELLVRADESKIDQVMHNLIDNALKFSNTDSEVWIGTKKKNEKVFVSVRDFGIGIPKDSLKKIWERFYKTDPSRGKDKKGTGLGLSIVREIIRAHKEHINVISTEGVGTEFIFTLPPSQGRKTSGTGNAG